MNTLEFRNFLWIYSLAILLIFPVSIKSETRQLQYLKDAFKGKFYIGTDLNTAQITSRDTTDREMAKDQFNAIVAENCMKSAYLQPKQGEFDFALADQFVDFGQKKNLFITGHTLIWHSQLPGWFFTDRAGNEVSKEMLTQRMRNHIHTVVRRYKGRLKGWDVVNQAILDQINYLKDVSQF